MSYLTAPDYYDGIDTSVPPINLSGRQHYFNPTSNYYKKIKLPSPSLPSYDPPSNFAIPPQSQAPSSDILPWSLPAIPQPAHVYPSTIHPSSYEHSNARSLPPHLLFHQYFPPSENLVPQLNPFDVVKGLFFENKNTVKPKHYNRPKMREKGTDPVWDQPNLIEIPPSNENHDPFEIIPAVPNEDKIEPIIKTERYFDAPLNILNNNQFKEFPEIDWNLEIKKKNENNWKRKSNISNDKNKMRDIVSDIEYILARERSNDEKTHRFLNDLNYL